VGNGFCTPNIRDSANFMLRAAMLMIVGMACIPAGDTAGKILASSHGVEPVFVAWSRFAVGAVVAWFVVRSPDLSVFRDWRVWFRAGLLASAIMSILTALKTAPIADAFGAFFIGPVVAYALSAILLREPVSALRTTLMGTAVIGVVLIVQPGGSVQPGIGFALLAGVFYGAFLTASKWLVEVAPPRTLWLSQLTIPAIALAPLGLTVLPPPTVEVAALTLASALFSAAGNLLLIVAMGLTDSTRLAPLVYFQLVAATVLGAVVFGTFPGTLALVGLVLVVLSGFGSLAARR